jgi:hypothetical protein
MENKEIQNEAELNEILSHIPIKDEEQKKKVICSMFGHSKIVIACWGYINCGRCGYQLGDTLAGCYDTRNLVIIGHSCETCRKNYEKMTWKDKLLVPDPFK